MTVIRTNAVYRFTLSNPDDEATSIDDLNRLRYDRADVLVLEVGAALSRVEALDGAVFYAWHQRELTDVAVTDAHRFASHRLPTSSHGGTDGNRCATPPFGRGEDSPLRRRLVRDEEAADSIAAVRESAQRAVDHPALAGELGRTFGFAEGVREYARYLRTGGMSDALAKILT